jgi:hypothetical protein
MGMSDIHQILRHYDRLRRQGVAVKAALETLRTVIDPLPQEIRLELAHSIRAYEKAPPRRPARTQPSAEVEETADETNPRLPSDWVTCPHCGKSNKPEDHLCYACGQLLIGVDDSFQTHVLESDDSPANDYFDENSVLILTARNSKKNYEIRPQDSERELVLGRCTARSTMTPDIDLSDSEGNRLGVSRLHISIRYDRQYHTLTVFDLGSANGTFVNGQRLHPHEVRVMHHQDELRLGNMILIVTFKR